MGVKKHRDDYSPTSVFEQTHESTETYGRFQRAAPLAPSSQYTTSSAANVGTIAINALSGSIATPGSRKPIALKA